MAPLIVFGLVVFVHELGHFVAAKLVGVYAPVFSFGWGKRAWGFKRGETDYRISWLPIGGFVAMATRDAEAAGTIEGGTEFAEGSENAEKPGHQNGFNPIPYDPEALRPFGPKPVPASRWIESKGLLAKVFVLSAGVIMNIILAFVVISGSVMVMGRPYQPAVIDSVVAGKPAALAGMVARDSVVAVNGAAVKSWSDFTDVVRATPGAPVAVTVVRAGHRQELTITPESVKGTDDVTEKSIQVGQIGVFAINRNVREYPGFVGSLGEGLDGTGEMADMVFRTVKGLFVGDVSVKQLGGPIAIARASFTVARSGVENLIRLIAFISVNLAIINLLPIPLLDGGQILIRVIEAAKGSEFSARTQEYIMRAGVVAVLGLFVLVTFNDIVRAVHDLIGRFG